MNYPFPLPSYRARCTNVVDGDTLDVLIDLGLHTHLTARIRLLGIDTAEMNAKDPVERQRAQDARAKVVAWVQATDPWPLRVTTHKSDSFGRWLAKVYFQTAAGECCVNDELLRLGLAVPYVRKVD